MTELEDLTAKQACAELLARYAKAVNERDVDTFVSLFTDDGAWNRPGAHSMVGHDAIREFIDYALPNPAERTLRHVNGASLIELADNDTASSWSQTVVYDIAQGAPFPVPLGNPDMVVEYRDQMVRTAEGWKIAVRDTVVVFAASEIPRPQGEEAPTSDQ